MKKIILYLGLFGFFGFRLFSGEPERTVEKSQEVADAFEKVLESTPEEMAKPGNEGEVPPIRFPVGSRGERIRAYEQKARQSEFAELSALLTAAEGNAPVLREIISGLSRSENHGAVPLVKPYLSSPLDEVRAIAAMSWGKIGKKEDLPVIQALTDDKNPTVRLAATMSISVLESL